MKKKMIALAVAGVLAAPAAMAEVDIYGKIRLSVDFNSNNATAAGTEDSAVSVTSHSSRIGFKGSEDLDGGMKAIWQIESQIEMDEGGTNDADFSSKLRNTFGGITGGFGTVVLGTHDTPYKMTANKVEVFGDTVADYNAIIQGDTRSANVIAYLSPDFGGLSFAAAYVPSYTNDDLPQTEAESEQTATSFGVTFKTGDLMVGAATETLSGVATDTTYTKVGATYALGATKLGLVYEITDIDEEQDAIYASVTHKMGKTTLKAAFGQLGDSGVDANADGSDDNDGSTLMAIGVFQSLAENTEAYVIYADVSNDDDGTNSLKTFGGVPAGENASSFSIGLNHNF